METQKTQEIQKMQDAQKKKKSPFKRLIAVVGFLAAIVLFIAWRMRGSLTTTGRFPNNKKTEVLTCESATLEYEKITVVSSDRRKTRIVAMFDSSGEISTLFLEYQMYFDSPEKAKNASAQAHYEFSKGLSDHGLDFSEFENKFSLYDDRFTLLLYSKDSEMNSLSASYFIVNNENKIPSSIYDYQKNYESQGFTCETTAE